MGYSSRYDSHGIKEFHNDILWDTSVVEFSYQNDSKINSTKPIIFKK